MFNSYISTYRWRQFKEFVGHGEPRIHKTCPLPSPVALLLPAWRITVRDCRLRADQATKDNFIPGKTL
jgi:hypothetical protein